MHWFNDMSSVARWTSDRLVGPWSVPVGKARGGLVVVRKASPRVATTHANSAGRCKTRFFICAQSKWFPSPCVNHNGDGNVNGPNRPNKPFPTPTEKEKNIACVFLIIAGRAPRLVTGLGMSPGRQLLVLRPNGCPPEAASQLRTATSTGRAWATPGEPHRSVSISSQDQTCRVIS